MSAPPTGLVVVDKDPGMTSHDVVARVRRLAGTRKVGHAGTLDPMATGVLVLGVGRATRLLGHLALGDKDYAATVRLGASTTTDDAEGELLTTTSADALDPAQVRSALAEQVGDVDQVPSAVSAVKVDGKRAYARVRAGEDVVLAPRRVRISSLEVDDLRRGPDVVDLDVRVTCSSGTYVRAIARDLGARLGVGGHLTALRRTRVGPFTLDRARTLDRLAEQVEVVGLAEAARLCFTSLELSEQQAARVRVGGRLETDLPTPGPVALLDPDGELLALYEQRGPVAAALAVFVG